MTISKQDVLNFLVQELIENDRALGSLALHCEFIIMPDGPDVCWVGGNKIYFREDFFGTQLRAQEKLGILAHEVLHVAMQHAWRGKMYKKRTGQFSPEIWTIACDVPVNNALKGTWCSIPSDAVQYEHIREMLPPQYAQKPANEWSPEDLYEVLMHSNNGQQPSGGNTINDLAQAIDSDEADPESCGGRTEEENAEFWQDKINTARGLTEENVLRRIEQAAYKHIIPWEELLASFMSSVLTAEPEMTWKRPSRTTRVYNGQYGIFPGYQWQKYTKKLGIVFDTSGSIDEKILSIFKQVANKILAATGGTAICVDCDAAVHQIVRAEGKIPPNYHFRGGGGTDFRPALKALETESVDGAVYLTDLYGEFPAKKPPFPVLWASTAKENKAPFGRTVYLEPRR